MAKKVFVPVFPSERFYDAVVRAGDIVSDEGGSVTFAFTRVRPPPEAYAEEADGRPAELDVATEAGDFDGPALEWRDKQIAALEDARQLLYDRGLGEDQIEYLFADEADAEGAAQAIADEAAAGAYDVVLLSRGYFVENVHNEEATPEDVVDAVREIDGLHLLLA